MSFLTLLKEKGFLQSHRLSTVINNMIMSWLLHGALAALPILQTKKRGDMLDLRVLGSPPFCHTRHNILIHALVAALGWVRGTSILLAQRETFHPFWTAIPPLHGHMG